MSRSTDALRDTAPGDTDGRPFSVGVVPRWCSAVFAATKRILQPWTAPFAELDDAALTTECARLHVHILAGPLSTWRPRLIAQVAASHAADRGFDVQASVEAATVTALETLAVGAHGPLREGIDDCRTWRASQSRPLVC